MIDHQTPVCDAHVAQAATATDSEAPSAARATDPGREIAKIALADTYGQPGNMLEAVIRYAFVQLCWHRDTPQLEAFAESFREIFGEDA